MESPVSCDMAAIIGKHFACLYSHSGRALLVKKIKENQSDSRRSPSQTRAQVKVELILEASRRILERDGIEGFTTNHVAELAGVSIGTLYQYFPNKQRVLDELALRELGALTREVMTVITSDEPVVPGARVRAVIRAIVSAYGGRTGVHGVLMHYLLSRGAGTPLPQLRAAVIQYFTDIGLIDANHQRRTLDEAEAFVLTHAISGVLRAMLNDPQTLEPGSRQAIEDALVRMVVNFT
ncbi:TetR/AcrR family transcriptional regulator [Pseudomonas fluorescens]|uniref:TetR/AcrR family transcriptional regulator n=1 Tax=Pseudomonas fluorescens TaxID=294 RepID=UPI0037F7E9EE